MFELNQIQGYQSLTLSSNVQFTSEGYFEIAQKVIEEDQCHIMAYEFDFEIVQYSNHSVSL